MTGKNGTAILDAETGAETRRFDISGRRVAWFDETLAISDEEQVVVVRDDVLFTVSQASRIRELPHRRNRYPGITERPATAQELAELFGGAPSDYPQEEPEEDDGIEDDSLRTDIGEICDAVFTKDGSRLIVASVWAFGTVGATLSVVDMTDGAIVRKKTINFFDGDHESLYARIALSPDGNRVALACDGIGLYYYDPDLGDFYEATGLAGLEAMGFGGLVDALGLEKKKKKKDRKRPRKMSFGEPKTRSVAFSPDGKTLAVGLTDRLVVMDPTNFSIRHRDLYSTETAVPPPLEEDENPVQAVGEAIHCRDGTIIPPSTIIHADPLSATEKQERQFQGAAKKVIAVSIAGNVLAAASKTGVKLFDVTSGAHLDDIVLPQRPLDLAYRPSSVS